jgi:succinyl-CoA:acetate CoA-transferase
MTTTPPTRENPIPAARIVGDLPTADAATAAETVGEEATLFVSGFGGVGYPKSVPEMIAAGDHRRLTVISGGGVGDEIDTALVESGDMDRRYPFQTRPTARDAINAGEVAFHDRHIADVADDVRFDGLRAGVRGERVAVVEAVAVGPDWLVPTTSVGNTPAFVRAADRIIVEVNMAQPLDLSRVHDVYTRADPPARGPIPLSTPAERIGSPAIRFDPDDLAAVVQTNRRDDPYEFRDPNDTDQAIAAHLQTFLTAEIARNPLFSDAVTLQFGVGSLGNALMSALTELDIGDRPLVYFGEVIQDGLLDMVDAGRLAGASATSLALSADGQDRLFEDVSRYAEEVVLRPGAVSNAAGPIDRFGVAAVNSAVEVDLHGNANATHIGGTHVLNGIGGSGDFVRNARLSIITLPATAADGDISRIVPATGHVDHTDHDVDVVVTEHGVADLRGLSLRERAAALVDIADPAYSSELEEYRERVSKESGAAPMGREMGVDL